MAFLLGAIGLGSLLGESKTTIKNTTDVLNEAITNITTSVLNSNSTAVSSAQLIDLKCDPMVAIKAMEICANSTNPDCNVCTASDLNQEITLSINMQNVNNNTVATQIKDEINAKLEKEVQNVKGASFMTKTKTDIENLSTIKNKLLRNYNNNLVNDSIKNFAFSQTIKSENVKTNKISQKLVATVIASEIVNNALNNDANFKQDIAALDKIKNTETGLFQDIGSSISGIIGTTFSGVKDLAGTLFQGAMGMFIIGLIILGVLLWSGVLCAVPPLMPYLMMAGMCSSSKKNRNDDDDYDDRKFRRKHQKYEEDLPPQQYMQPQVQPQQYMQSQQYSQPQDQQYSQPQDQQYMQPQVQPQQYNQSQSQVQPQDQPQQYSPTTPVMQQHADYSQSQAQPQSMHLPNINMQNPYVQQGLNQALNRAPPMVRQSFNFARDIIPKNQRPYV